MYERFTDRSRKVMQLANQEAQRFNHEYIGTEHILLGLVKEGAGVAANVLKNLDIDLKKVRMEVEKIVQSGPDMVTIGKIPHTPRAKKVIEYAIEEVQLLNHNYVGTEHLLLGLVREEEGVAAQVLLNLGVRLEAVREEVLNLLAYNPGERPSGRQPTRLHKTPTLTRLGVDLTALAHDGRLVPCVGRGNEIDRTLLVMGCRRESNPLLVGPTGVGKASIIWGLARLAASDNPPEVLRGRRVVHVFLRTAVIDAKDDSQRLLLLARALGGEARQAGNIVLFVEDLFAYGHDSRLFKAALDLTEVQCIAAATPETYRSSVVVDPVFGHNFQPVFVEPPAAGEVVAILRAHRDDYQDYHGVQIADDALTAAAELSERYLTEGCQPAKALRLLDQATALFRMRHPPVLPDTRELDMRIEELNGTKERAIGEQDFEKAAGYRDEAEKLRKKKEQLLNKWSAERPRIDGVVDAAAVEQAVTKLTGVQFRGSDAIRAKPESL
ncbi:MAG TPA: Clp protease N-terminal domain-containing protein [Gemmataceae bacterium]|nr:Clp protease N-terminal domain-containing protein [Gemmataceae bacterium]